MFLGWAFVSTLVERKHMLNLVSWNWPLMFSLNRSNLTHPFAQKKNIWRANVEASENWVTNRSAKIMELLSCRGRPRICSFQLEGHKNVMPNNAKLAKPHLQIWVLSFSLTLSYTHTAALCTPAHTYSQLLSQLPSLLHILYLTCKSALSFAHKHTHLMIHTNP